MDDELSMKTESGLFIPRRIKEAAEKLRLQAMPDGMDEPDGGNFMLAVADVLDAFEKAWLGSEQDWCELRDAYPVLRLCDVILGELPEPHHG